MESGGILGKSISLPSSPLSNKLGNLVRMICLELCLNDVNEVL